MKRILFRPFETDGRRVLFAIVGVLALSAAACAAPIEPSPALKIQFVSADDALEQEERDAQKAMLRSANTTSFISAVGVLVSLAGVVFAAAGVGVSAVGLSFIYKQLKATDEALKHSSTAAQAAADAASTSLATARPWLMISEGPSQGLLVDRLDPAEGSGLTFDVTIENIGPMPALGVKVYVFAAPNSEWGLDKPTLRLPEGVEHRRWGDIRPEDRRSNQLSAPWSAADGTSTRLIVVATYEMPGRNALLTTAQPFQVTERAPAASSLSGQPMAAGVVEVDVTPSSSFRSIYI